MSFGDNGSGSRVLLVSNRLPVSIRTGRKGTPEVMQSAGGLATGLKGVHERSGGLWFGWPGDLPADPARREQVFARLAEMRLVPLSLSQSEVEHFYEGVSNGVLWPLFHYLIEQVPAHPKHWNTYVAVNERMADLVCTHARPGDVIWVHDYQLLLLPRLLRARLPDLRIGFFLHIPFPSSEVFRILPWREQILEGMLGADLIGFHTYDYLRHFSTSLLRILGIESRIDRLDHGGRTIRLGAFPMGIDVAAFEKLAAEPLVIDEAAKIRAAHGTEKLILGVDRLDYTKGLQRRLIAFERVLEREPTLRDRIRLMQIAVPSREKVDAYRTLRAEVEGLVGHINGMQSSLSGGPIHYVYRNLPVARVVAAYRAADVMLVTPLRDGMNLVAKEYVASRIDGDGVLVLSELAGAASELGEAITVNPYDVDAIAAAIVRSVRMPETERRERMAALRERICARPIEVWASSFLDVLEPTTQAPRIRTLSSAEITAEARTLAPKKLTALIDYDGTLVGIKPTPPEAKPDAELLELLEQLTRVGVEVHVVSGRPRAVLQEWLGALPITIHADHGLFTREATKAEWERNVEGDIERWRPQMLDVMTEYVARTPGAFIEEKECGLAWHYRGADPQLGSAHARELRIHLAEVLAQLPVHVLQGHKVIEVRAQGVDKSLAAARATRTLEPGAQIIAFGDDRTDEDLFRALPDEAIRYTVGSVLTGATSRLAGPADVRALLREIIARRRVGDGATTSSFETHAP